MWYVYILTCSGKTLYTGITTDLKRRVNEHNDSKLGAKYTRTRRPVKLVYSCRVKNKSSAAKLEWHIKKMTRQEKMELIKEKSTLSSSRRRGSGI